MSKEKLKATVFGAGVAGLTVAHELVIRGFKVMVIDPNLNHVIGPRTNDRGVGGMARSQFAVDTGAAVNDGEIRRLRRAPDFLRDATFEFTFANGATEVLERRPRDADLKFQNLVKELQATESLAKLQINLPRSETDAAKPPEQDPRAIYLADMVKIPVQDLIDQCVNFASFEGFDDKFAFFNTGYAVLPAEHGFRFFPSFYRHLFDTMRRTPVAGTGGTSAPPRSVFDNLVPVENLGFARAGTKTSFTIPRRPTASLDEFRQNLEKVLSELDWSGEDLSRFGLKLFKYMTSSTHRREKEYEHISWSDFVDLDKFTDVMQKHIEYGPQMMASLRGSASDARTQGTIVVQLLMDYLQQGVRPDCILAGPTSGMWFNHWHDYLMAQGVKFCNGSVIGFDDDGTPIANGRFAKKDFPPEPGSPADVVRDVRIKDGYVVFALPIGPMTRLAEECHSAAHSGRNDLRRLVEFMEGAATTATKRPQGPLRHMSGIQYYFDNQVTFWAGHTQYLDSQWGLTSISQPQFWFRNRNPTDAYRSLLSVDIGIWDTPFATDAFPSAKNAEDASPMEIAQGTWAQIKDHHDEAFAARYGKVKFPIPTAFALDQALEFDAAGLTLNAYPFVVNEVHKFELRPGLLSKTAPKAAACYEVWGGRFVMAGTHMKTFTRITSMESANESARHAVNAILSKADIACDRCDIWDPEDYESPDLSWLKDMDEQLSREGRPHLVDILDWSELPSGNFPFSIEHLIAQRKLFR